MSLAIDLVRHRFGAIHPRLIALAALGFLSIAAMPTVAHAAHDDLHQQIAAVSEELRLSPGTESLLIRRGDLYRRHEEWDLAFEDLAAVRDLRGTRAFALTRARLFRDRGFLAAAQVVVETHLEANPRDGIVRVMKAELLGQRDRFAESLVEYDRAVATLLFIEPDVYLARARVAATCTELGDEALPRALRGLDEGLAKLGMLPALQLLAIEFELRLGAHERALTRLDDLAARGGRQESWLAQRAGILLAAGRRDEARESYRSALEAIRRLRSKQRASDSVQSLEREVLQRLSQLNSSSTTHTEGPRSEPSASPDDPR